MPAHVAPPDAPHPAPPGHRLNSWKEIAAHLGKSVRTVQRWEQALGLPVHRMGHEGGEIVWANVAELDAWIISQSSPAHTPGDPTPPAQAHAAPTVTTSGRRWVLTAVLGLSTIAAAAGFQAWRTSTQLDAVDWAVQGNSIVGLAGDGRTLWTYVFPEALDSSAFSKPLADRPGSKLMRYDIDGDGRLETLVAFGNRSRPLDSALHVLESDGTLRFPPVQHTGSVTFGSTSYHGPWNAQRLFVTTTGGGDIRIHISFIHLNEFPSVLLTLDRDGQVVSEYWSNGYIETVNSGMRDGKRIWLVGATHNDTKGASLAIFDAEPQGSAPARQDDYVCSDCPEGSPADFVVMPRLCMAPAWTVTGQATVTEAYTDESGLVFAHVREGPIDARGVPRSEVIYSFDPTLRQASAFVTTGLVITHRDMEKEGLLKHSWSPAEEATLFPALKWDGTRFIELPRGKVTY